jgi:hypothetical protein
VIEDTPRRLALSKSSLSLTHGLPSTDANLMTMFNALDFSVPLLDKVLKSFVRKVPIPNSAADHHLVAPLTRLPPLTREFQLVALLLQSKSLYQVQGI